MPALNFQKRFVSKILSGEKRQTIRAKRKNPIKVNDTLQLWTGQRTKRAKHLIDVQCGDILDIEITENEIIINDNRTYLIVPKRIFPRGISAISSELSIFLEICFFRSL